jgi:hypothetical protein
MRGVTASGTATVEIDRELLAQLRQDAPGKSDRELLEDLAVIQLGDKAIANIREAFAGVPDEEIAREAVKGVREVRRKRAGPRRAKD